MVNKGTTALHSTNAPIVYTMIVPSRNVVHRTSLAARQVGKVRQQERGPGRPKWRLAIGRRREQSNHLALEKMSAVSVWTITAVLDPWITVTTWELPCRRSPHRDWPCAPPRLTALPRTDFRWAGAGHFSAL